jgi:exosome complex RNA-binding protein Rrp42 (RNase PH superfamily)
MLEMCGQSVSQGSIVPPADHNRIIVLQAGLINQANGSAYIETERTKIACAVLVIYRLPYIKAHHV